MGQKLKPAIIAFSGLIIYSALCTSLSYLLTDHVYVKLIAKCFVVLLGSIYMKTVLRYPPVYDKPSAKYLIATLISIVLFVFASLFTSTWFAKILTPETVSVTSEHVVLSIFISVVLTPAAEEIMFRGFMYRQLACYNKTMAIIVSTIVFTIFHGTLIHLYTATIGGLLLCCIYIKTQKLRYSIAAHSLFNALTLLLNMIDFADWFISAICVFAVNMLCVAAIIVLFILKAYDKPYYEKQAVSDVR